MIIVILPLLILSFSIGSRVGKKKTPEMVAELLAILADLHERLDPAVDGGSHGLRWSRC